MIRRCIIFLAFCFVVVAPALFSQTPRHPFPDQARISSVADDIQRGIVAGDITTFSKHFAKQVFVDLPGQEAGYFSENQLYYILQNFFSSRLAQQFRFSTVDESEMGPYATGSGIFLFKGRREVLQVYVAFSRIDNRVVITQFNVY